MANILDFGGVRVLTSNAQPGAGYVAKFYVSGTTTPVTVYTDSTLGTAHGVSVTADAAGIFPAVWSSGGAVKCVIEDALGAVVQTIDPVLSVSGAGSAAEDVTFTPTIDLPFTNVQDAIEGAAASAASGFATYGIGITGNATLLANLDATNIGAGVYRFDGTTTGTYPTGVAAADTGLVEHWRQAGATAMQFLYHATTDRIFHRRMASSTWGTWRENITVNQGAVEGDTMYRGASAWTRLPKGTAAQALVMNAGATAPEWGSSIAPQTAVAAAAQTSIPFTGVPSWVNRINVHLAGLSTSGTSPVTIRIGDSGGIENTGYSGTVSATANGVATAAANVASGFNLSSGAQDVAAAERNGTITIQRLGPGSNTWIASGSIGFGNSTATATIGASKTLSDVLTQLAITTIGGTDTFDAGSVGVSWE